MVAKNATDQPAQSSQLFMLRLWPEDLGSGQTDWRGRVQHVNSGEARYFRDWGTLEAFVEKLLTSSDPTHPGAGEGEGADRASPET
jgi:hypothetical protein